MENMIDKRLLYVERYLEETNEDIDLSEILELSQRQLTRLLNSWQEDGYITYQPGVGRGNKMKIKLNVDVERELFYHLRNNLHKLSLEEIQEYLTLPWHPSSENAIRRNLMDEYQEEDKVLMDYVYHIPKEFHPTKAIDLVSTTVIFQVFDTLYNVDQEGNLKYNLVRFEEWEDNKLHIYLKKNIFFSNGDEMNTTDVQNALETVRASALYSHLFSELKGIKVVDDYHIELLFDRKVNYIRYMLCESFSAIYREVDGELLGSGNYAVHAINDDEIVLKVNKFNGSLRPDIRTIYLIDNMDKYYQYNTLKYAGGNVKTCYRGNDFLVLNPNTTMSFEQRKFLKLVCLALVRKMLYKREYLTKWIGEVVEVLPPKEEAPIFHQPLKFITDEHTLYFFNTVKDALKETYGIESETIEMSHYDYLSTDLKSIDGDIVWMSESYQQSQPLKTLNLLSHCKFLEWYRDEADALEVFDKAAYMDDEQFKPIAVQYLNNLSDECYMIQLQIKHRILSLPEGLKNIIELPYGVLDYSKIITQK